MTSHADRQRLEIAQDMHRPMYKWCTFLGLFLGSAPLLIHVRGHARELHVLQALHCVVDAHNYLQSLPLVVGLSTAKGACQYVPLSISLFFKHRGRLQAATGCSTSHQRSFLPHDSKYSEMLSMTTSVSRLHTQQAEQGAEVSLPQGEHFG